MNEAKSSTRLLFIDNVRIFLTFLVVMHHTLITYGGSGGWYFKDPLTDKVTSIVFSVLCGLNQGFFMALFFFISAYFVPGSYNRKKTWRFLSDRLIRLGIPIIIYSSIINPIMVYLLWSKPGKPFCEYYLSYFQSGAVFNGTGPLWFLVALLIYAICYCIWREFVKDHTDGVTVQKRPSMRFLALAVFSIGISGFLIRLWFPVNGGATILNIQLAFVAQYIVALILGTIAYKNNWFSSITDSQGKQWLNIALISIFFFGAIAVLSGFPESEPVKMFGGFHWQSFSFAIWEGVYGIGMCIGLVVFFRKKFNTQGKIKKMLSDNAYAIYIIHAPVLVGISSLVVNTSFPPAIKFVVVLPIVLGLCLIISHFILRRIPGAKRVLG